MPPRQFAPQEQPRELVEGQLLPNQGLTPVHAWWSSPIFLGIVLGVAVWCVWAGPYWLYNWNFDTLAESAPRLTKLLTKEPWLGRIMSSWINMFTVICFCIAVLILRDRSLRLRREGSAFDLHLIGEDDETLILPDDALECRKRLRQLGEPEQRLSLVRLLAAGLQRARANWSAEDVGQAIKNQTELLQMESEASYSIVKYLVWAIPSIGFIGTVMGVADAIYDFRVGAEKKLIEDAIGPATGHLYVAFDTTLVALILSLIVMLMFHRVQAVEDTFLSRATEWCMQRFVLRMHISKES